MEALASDEIAQLRGEIAAGDVVLKFFLIEVFGLEVGMSIPFAGKVVILASDVKELSFLSLQGIGIVDAENVFEVGFEFGGMFRRIATIETVKAHVFGHAGQSSKRRQTRKKQTERVRIEDFATAIVFFGLPGGQGKFELGNLFDDGFHLRRHGHNSLLR